MTNRRYPGGDLLRSRPPPSSYTGPGDIVSGALAWGGLFAYNAAKCGASQCIRVRRASDNTESDIGITAAGALDIAAALTFAGTDATGTGAITGTALTFTGGNVGDMVTGGTTAVGTYIVSGSSPTWTVNISQTVVSTTLTLTWSLFISKLYDQTGNANDFVQATAANQPRLITAGGPSSALPYILFGGFGGIQFLRLATSFASSQPFSASFVSYQTGNGSYQTVWRGGSPISLQDYTDTIPAQIRSYAGAITSVSEANSVWHSFNTTFNGASSSVNIDGSDNAASLGTSALNNSGSMTIGADESGAEFLIGRLGEIGWWPSGFSSGNRSAVSSNQHTRWNF